jgi:hypothetical protein
MLNYQRITGPCHPKHLINYMGSYDPSIGGYDSICSGALQTPQVAMVGFSWRFPVHGLWWYPPIISLVLQKEQLNQSFHLSSISSYILILCWFHLHLWNKIHPKNSKKTPLFGSPWPKTLFGFLQTQNQFRVLIPAIGITVVLRIYMYIYIHMYTYIYILWLYTIHQSPCFSNIYWSTDSMIYYYIIYVYNIYIYICTHNTYGSCREPQHLLKPFILHGKLPTQLGSHFCFGCC